MADPGVAKDRELASWRRRLLPLMSGVLMALTGVFVIASFWQIHDIQQRIDAPDRSSADSVFRTLEQQMGSGRVAVPAGYADVRMIAALETDALTRKHELLHDLAQAHEDRIETGIVGHGGTIADES